VPISIASISCTNKASLERVVPSSNRSTGEETERDSVASRRLGGAMAASIMVLIHGRN
jgi:hypothetical protein